MKASSSPSVPRISVPGKPGVKSQSRILGLLRSLKTIPGMEDLKVIDTSVSVGTDREFGRKAVFLEAFIPRFAQIEFRRDYTVRVVSVMNQSRKWDFDSDWREGVAQVLSYFSDKVGSELGGMFEHKAKQLWELSKQAGY